MLQRSAIPIQALTQACNLEVMGWPELTLVGWVKSWQANHALPWKLCRPLKLGSPEAEHQRGTQGCLADDTESSCCLAQFVQPPFGSAKSQRMARGVQQGWDSCRNSTRVSASPHIQPALHVV